MKAHNGDADNREGGGGVTGTAPGTKSLQGFESLIAGLQSLVNSRHWPTTGGPRGEHVRYPCELQV